MPHDNIHFLHRITEVRPPVDYPIARKRFGYTYSISDRIEDALGMSLSSLLICAGVVALVSVWLAVGHS